MTESTPKPPPKQPESWRASNFHYGGRIPSWIPNAGGPVIREAQRPLPALVARSWSPAAERPIDRDHALGCKAPRFLAALALWDHER